MLRYIAGPRSWLTPITRIVGSIPLTAAAIPPISPPPDIGTTTVRVPGRSARISRPAVPCPAITMGSSKGCTNVRPSSSTSRRAAASASSCVGPATTTRAPSAAIASDFTDGTRLLKQTTASIPRSAETRATARPWLPLETATTPRRRSSEVRETMRLVAPRSLNDPVS